MKKVKIFVFLLFIFTLKSFSQDAPVNVIKNLPKYDFKKIHFGFTIGINSMDFVIRNSDIFYKTDTISNIYGVENTQHYGFHLGPITSFRLGEHFDLRALINLSFGQRDLNYKIVNDDTIESKDPFRIHTMKIETIYMEFPVLIKFKSDRVNNYRGYLIAGLNPKIDLASQKKIKESEKPKVRLNSFDLCWEAGAGFDFYLEYFKLAVELKFSGGMLNVLTPDNTEYTSGIGLMRSKMFLLSFHFE